MVMIIKTTITGSDLNDIGFANGSLTRISDIKRVEEPIQPYFHLCHDDVRRLYLSTSHK